MKAYERDSLAYSPHHPSILHEQNIDIGVWYNIMIIMTALQQYAYEGDCYI